MNNNIEWIRARKSCGVLDIYDVYYKSGRMRMFVAGDAPQSVIDFLVNATKKIIQFDKLWGAETIYKA